MKPTSAQDRIRTMCDQLAKELIRFWAEDEADVLTLPPAALRRLAADYLIHREVYRGKS